MITINITIIPATIYVPHVLCAIALFTHSQFKAVTVYAIPEMNKLFRLMNAPVIETTVVIDREAINSPDIPRIFILKNGVIFRISAIITKNMINTIKNTIASVTLIAVDSLWRFSPKNPPMRVCQTGETIIVPFHGLSLAKVLTSIFFKGFSVVSFASINGVDIKRNKTIITNFLFIYSLVCNHLNNLAMFKSWECM